VHRAVWVDQAVDAKVVVVGDVAKIAAFVVETSKKNKNNYWLP